VDKSYKSMVDVVSHLSIELEQLFSVILLSLQKLSRGIMESPAYVCLSTQLSVCLLPG